MALVRVLVALYARDVIVVLQDFFLLGAVFVVVCVSVILNQDFLAFSICNVSTFFSLFSSLPICPFNYVKYFFCLCACDGIVANC